MGATLLSVFGVALMVGVPGATRSFAGDLLVFTSLLTTVAWVLVMQPLLQRYPPLVATAYTMAVGTLALAPFAWWMGGTPRLAASAGTWTALAGLGIGCTAVTYSLWNWGLRHVEAARAGVYVNLEPFIGALLGILFFGDPLGAGTLAGGVLVLSAAFVITTEKRASSASEDDDRLTDGQSYAELTASRDEEKAHPQSRTVASSRPPPNRKNP